MSPYAQATDRRTDGRKKVECGKLDQNVQATNGMGRGTGGSTTTVAPFSH